MGQTVDSPKRLKEKLGNAMHIKTLKISDTFLGLYKTTCMPKAGSILMKYLKSPKISSLSDFEALCKQEVKAKAELQKPDETEGVPPNAHRAPLRRLGDLVVPGTQGCFCPIIN